MFVRLKWLSFDIPNVALLPINFTSISNSCHLQMSKNLSLNICDVSFFAQYICTCTRLHVFVFFVIILVVLILNAD